MTSLRATFINSLGVFAGSVALVIAAYGAGAAPDPTVSLSLRGVAARTIEVGEPLFVAVRLDPPDGQPASLAPKPAHGSWRDALTVELVRAAGGAAVARGRAVPGRDEPGPAGDEEWALRGSWWFAAEDVSRLAPGSYLLQAVFQMREGSGWKGAAMAEPLTVKIVAPSGIPGRVRQKTLSLALAAAAEGEPQKATEILDEALRQDPDAIPVLVTRAQLALSVGDARAAALCLRRARALTARIKGKPSVVLHELAIQINQAMADPAVRDAPSAWAQLPPGVLAPVRPESPAPSPIVPQQQTGIPATGAAGSAVVPRPAAAPVPAHVAAIPAVVAAVAPPASAKSTPRAAGVIVPAAEIDDAKIRTDTAGQWAASATAGSQYSTPKYAAAQATGAPNIAWGMAGDNPDAWCPAKKDSGEEWLEVTFSKPVPATEVRVRQNNAPGAIAKIELIAPDGTTQVAWAGVDPYVAPAVREIAWFAVRVPKTSYAVAKVKITLNLATGSGWKQIDAVQLVGTVE